MSPDARGPFEPGGPARVVIDDSAAQRAALAAMLEAGGFTDVRTAASAPEAGKLDLEREFARVCDELSDMATAATVGRD